jgi:predicted component of type VI protein secretion system
MSTAPDPAHQGAPAPSSVGAIRLKLSLKGQPIQAYGFDNPIITVGRQPDCDICVDNPGVSRQHFRIERNADGEYRVLDQGSANGTYLNDYPIRAATLRDRDVIGFGKYSLEVGIERLVGGGSENPRQREPQSGEGVTVMLSAAEVRRMMAEGRPAEAPRPTPQHAPRHAPQPAPQHSPQRSPQQSAGPPAGPAPEPRQFTSLPSAYVFIMVILGVLVIGALAYVWWVAR